MASSCQLFSDSRCTIASSTQLISKCNSEEIIKIALLSATLINHTKTAWLWLLLMTQSAECTVTTNSEHVVDSISLIGTAEAD